MMIFSWLENARSVVLFYFFGMIVVFGIGIFFLLRSYEPGPRPVMKPSHPDSLEELAYRVYQRFYADFRDDRMIILGLDPSQRLKAFVDAFLQASEDNHRPFSQVFVDEAILDEFSDQLPNSFTGVLPFNVRHPQALAALLKDPPGRSLFLSLNIHTVQFLANNAITRLQELLSPDKIVFSLSIAPLAFSPEQKVQPACVGHQQDHSGTAAFGCAIRKASHKVYRQDFQGRGLTALMENHGQEDYLLFIGHSL